MNVLTGLNQLQQGVSVSIQLNHFAGGYMDKLGGGEYYFDGSKYLAIDTHRPSLIGLLLFCVQIVFPHMLENLKILVQHHMSI